MSNSLAPVNFYKGTYQQITSLNDASKSEFGLYFSNSPSYDIYSFDDASQLVSYTKLNISGSGPAINSYDAATKTLNRRNLNAIDISTGLGYVPFNLEDASITWVNDGSSKLYLKINDNNNSITSITLPPASSSRAGILTADGVQTINGTKIFYGITLFNNAVTVGKINGLAASKILTNAGGGDTYLYGNMYDGRVINIGNASLNDGSISYWISSNGEYYSGKSNSAFTISAFNGSSYTGNEIENINSSIASIPSLEMLKVWHGTLSEYNSLTTKDPSTIYFVEE